MTDFFTDIRNLLLPAMEEDITAQTQSIVDNTFGRSSSTPSASGAGSREKDDIGKTDDIFDLKDSSGGDDGVDDMGSDPDNSAASDVNDDTGAEDEEDSQENADDISNDTDGNGIDDTLEDENGNTTGINLKEVYQKNKLRDNMILFYNILCNNINLISDAIGNINEAKSIDVCNRVLENLREVKSHLYRDISDKLKGSSYEDLLRDYIALRRVYDISVEMLDKHFGNINSLHIGKKRKSK